MKKFLSLLGSFFLFLLFRLDSLISSVPIFIALALHFLIGFPLWWFWALLGVWFFVTVLRFIFLRLVMRGARIPDREQKNVNPYSRTKKDDEKFRQKSKSISN